MIGFIVHGKKDQVGVAVKDVTGGEKLEGWCMEDDSTLTVTANKDIPLGHKDAAYVRSHFDGMEVRLNDAPRANEIMVAIAVTDSGRPLPRVGGLSKDQIKGEDGLR